MSEIVLLFLTHAAYFAMSSAPTLIADRIHRRLGGPGAVVTPKDFLDLAGRAAVDQVLSRLVRSGVLIRVGRGLYHLPRTNPTLGMTVPPDPDTVAAAIGRQTGSRVAPSDAAIENRLGLSTQIAAKPFYVTTGRTRTLQIGNQTLRFKRVSPRRLPASDGVVDRALQALHGCGPDPDESVITTLRTLLSPSERRELLELAKYDTGWVARSARRVADG